MGHAATISSFDTVQADLDLKGFKVYQFDSAGKAAPAYKRRDFYKICLKDNSSRIHYADRTIDVEGPHLFFANPHVPYSVEHTGDRHSGLACLFTEDFLKGHERSESLHHSPLFRLGGTPVFQVNAAQQAFLTSLFQKMLAEQCTDYIYKKELIRSYISLILHEAMRMEPTDHLVQHKNAASRIATLFLNLLEQQFPIDTPQEPLQLRSAQDYADQLSVHVNHLNRSVKQVTGKPTTTHIAERITTEARALLQHTDWSVADVAYGLGFEYPTYFNNFFKKMTGATPRAIREAVV